MSAPRTRKPSPPAGEGGRERSERPGEGDFSKNPLRASRLRRSAPSPAAEEGTEQAARPANAALRLLRARALRSRMTDAERKLWFALRDRRFANFKFRRQVSVGRFIADFVCFDARVVIEVDGGQHAESESDNRRDAWFADNDFLVVRFWNNDVLWNSEGVLTSLLTTLQSRTPHPARASRGHPSPAGGEGTEAASRSPGAGDAPTCERRPR
jgi:very-short-patch-repair endonuclease